MTQLISTPDSPDSPEAFYIRVRVMRPTDAPNMSRLDPASPAVHRVLFATDFETADSDWSELVGKVIDNDFYTNL